MKMNEEEAENLTQEIREWIYERLSHVLESGDERFIYTERAYDDKGTFIRLGINIYYEE